MKSDSETVRGLLLKLDNGEITENQFMYQVKLTTDRFHVKSLRKTVKKVSRRIILLGYSAYGS